MANMVPRCDQASGCEGRSSYGGVVESNDLVEFKAPKSTKGI